MGNKVIEYFDMNRSDLGKIVARERKRSHLTQKQFAQQIRNNRGNVSAMECGYRKMSINTFSLLMREFGYDVKIALVKRED